MYKGDPGELNNWLTMVGKKQLIYEWLDVEMALLAYDTAEGLVFEFIEGHLESDSGLVWAELENPANKGIFR